MMHASSSRSSRGFSLVSVVLLVALLTVSGLVVLELVGRDLNLQGAERRSRLARAAAEGGAMELLNERVLLEALPLPEAGELSVAVPNPAVGVFSEKRADGVPRKYEGTVRLLRVSPVLESSYSRVRAVIYELEVNADAGGYRADVQAHFYKMGSGSQGLIGASRHAR